MKQKFVFSLCFFIVLACISKIYAQALTAIITSQDATCFDTLCDGSATITGSGGITPYTYSWSNGATGDTVTNLCAGTYTVIVYDITGDTAMATVTINNTNPIAYFIYSVSNLTVSFTDSSLGADTWLWDFGDGSPIETIQNPFHTYAVPGSYNVCLITSNGCGSDTVCQSVTLTVCQTTILGQVTDSAGSIISGIAELKSYSPNPNQMSVVATTTIDSLGNYTFTNMAQGQYLVIATGNSLLYPNTVPTYYDSTNHWQMATIINVDTCDTAIIANIKLIEFPTTIGFGKISGQITQPGPGKMTTGAGNPLPGVDLMLEQAINGVAVGYTITDSTGYYLFENIPEGDYKLYVDISGLPMDSTYMINITATDTVFTNLNFIADSTSINIAAPTSIKNNLTFYETNFYMYPNPFRYNTKFSYTIEQAGQVELVIHSYFGQNIITLVTEHQDKGSYSIEWNTTDIPPGLYFYTLRVDGIEWVKKAIRIK